MALGCGNGSAGKTASAPSTRAFPQVQIPAMYNDPQERLDYACAHYWDSFLSTATSYACDSTVINGVPAEELESSFSTYVSLLEGNSIETARRSAESLFNKLEAFQLADTSSNVFDSMLKYMEKYFYDPQSPYRNEDIYGAFLSRLVASPLANPDLVPSYKYTIEMCGLNMIGTPAADFRFTEIDGKTRTLYSIKSEYTLLFFSNPGCEACKEIIESLKSIPSLGLLHESGRLAVVNVYIDEEIDNWKAYQDYYPKTWYNGYDATYSIRENLYYNVRAIPSLYLLDADKTVIMKDAPQENVFRYLDNLQSQNH